MPLSARLAFAHAALQVIAAEARVDILHIKGVAVDASIGTVVGSGSDADVLVRPSHIPLFLEQLGAPRLAALQRLRVGITLRPRRHLLPRQLGLR